MRRTTNVVETDNKRFFQLKRMKVEMETKIRFLGLFTAIGNVIAGICYASMHFGLKTNWTVTKHEKN